MQSRTRSRPRPASGAICLALTLLLAAPSLAAQDVGTVTGRVTEAQSGEPVASTQVYIPGLDIGVLTQQNGRFLLQNVPSGTHTLTVERIGYRTLSREVTVAAGETLVENFQIAEEALQLDEVIVTGTPGGTQRRAIGNAVTRLDAGEVAASRPVNTMQDMLQGRSPGVAFARSSGNIGEGSFIRIRGVSSFSLGSQPLIYVDGVRIDNSTTLGPSVPNLGQSSSSTALDDLNPDNIESIEIIKGPSAATLYGTEASAGVIQIITKRGQEGAPQFDFGLTQGTNFLLDPAGKIGDQHRCVTGFPPCAREDIETFNILEREETAGNSPLDYGHAQRYNLSVRGGTEAINYFVSTEWNDQNGVVGYNWSERFSARANLGILVSEDLDLDLSLGWVSGDTRYASGSLEGGGLWPHLMWAQGRGFDTEQRGYLSLTPEEFAVVESTRDFSRFTGSATLSHNPTDWLRHRLTLGVDRGDEENQVLFPRDPTGSSGPFGGLSLGDVTVSRPVNTELTVDYSASATYSLNDAVTLTSSAGLQYYSSEFNEVEGVGRVFPSTAIRSIDGATETSTSQDFEQNKSLGVFVQQEVSWNDRVFVTGAVRGDDNSAFGSDFDAAVYPKFSATWVVSEEDFWNVGFINSLRLRSAWGKAGRQPGTFDAVTLFSPSVGSGGAPAITPATFGNPDLGPEVSSELELGFDAAFLDDRLSTEFTYYTRETTDALVSVPLSPTSGFPGNENANLGRLDSWGYELAANARAIDRGSWAIDIGASFAYTMNEIADLGGRQATNSLRIGMPWPNRTTDAIVGIDTDETGSQIFLCDAGVSMAPNESARDRYGFELGGATVPCSETEDYELLLGPTFSPWTWTTDVTLTLFDDLQVFGMIDAEHGRWINDYNLTCRTTACGFPNTIESLALDDPIYVESVLNANRHPSDDRLRTDHDASYVKLRELGLRYQIPEGWISGVGADRASFSFAARNLWYLWKAQDELGGMTIPSPETSDPTSSSGFALFQWPPLTSLEATLRVSF